VEFVKGMGDKLKRVKAACKLRFLGMALLAALGACTVRPPVAPPVAAPAVTAPLRELRAYDIDPSGSLLTILVFRGGLLASAGHNHVIASHTLTGTFRADPDQPLATVFEVHLPVDQLTIDEPPLREALHRADFPTEVPEEARAGTRRNMLSEAVLDASHHREIVLRSVGLQAGGEPGVVLAGVQATVRGQEHLIRATVRYELSGGELRARGQLALKQSDLGLTPFSAFLGALAVQDEMQVSFDLHALAVHQDPR
jgi:polyisoprenoid-binding protein YceI